jgi:Icc-related predicted phosphoesterase
MKVVAISDTHMQHDQLELPPGDLLIHAGDACNSGSAHEFIVFAKWFRRQAYASKVYVPGNHDRVVEAAPEEWVTDLLGPHVHVLVDSEVTIGGLRIFGQPWVPRCGFWSFEHDRGSDEMRAAREQIPGGLDILVTHAPPYGLCDAEAWAAGAPPENLGCRELRARVATVQPRVHVCGHIHGGRGSCETSWGGAVVNAARDVAVFEVEAG